MRQKTWRDRKPKADKTRKRERLTGGRGNKDNTTSTRETKDKRKGIRWRDRKHREIGRQKQTERERQRD